MKTELPIVSFETAILLKDAGFDLDTDYYYSDDGVIMSQTIDIYRCDWNSHPDDYLSAPTLDLAQMWLWKTQRIYVEINMNFIHNPTDRMKKVFEIFHYKIWNDLDVIYNSSDISNEEMCLGYDTPYTALEFGIQKACEYLIEKPLQNVEEILNERELNHKQNE